MVPYRLVTRPAFRVVGKQTWIGDQDNDLFGRFWQQCRDEGLFQTFERLASFLPGAVTNGVTLGISHVEENPAVRQFFYQVAVEYPSGEIPEGLQAFIVPASQWAVFECHGPVPDAIVEAEMFAFMQWLPASGFQHALAPEMEVYPPQTGQDYAEFWLPII